MDDPGIPADQPPQDQVTRFILQETIRAASSLLDPTAIAQLAVDHCRDILQMGCVALYWWDSANAILAPLAASGLRLQTPLPPISPGQGTVGTAFLRREPVVVDDLRQAGDMAAWERAQQLVSMAAMPLPLGDEARGVLLVARFTPQPITSREVRLLALIGAQLAPSLAIMQLLAEEQRRRAEAEAYAALLLQGAQRAAVGPVLDLITQYGSLLTGADLAAVALREEDGSIAWRSIWGGRSDLWQTIRYREGDGLAWQLCTDGQIHILDHLGENPAYPPGALPMATAEEARTEVVMPLRRAGTLLGALVLGWRTDVVPYQAQMHTAETLADYAATMISLAQAVEGLRAREHLLHSVVTNLPIILIGLDHEGRVTLQVGQLPSPGYRPPHLAAGRPIEKALADQPEAVEEARRALAGEAVTATRVIEDHTIEAHWLPTLTSDNTVEGAIGVFIDITEQARARQDAERARYAAEELARLRSDFVAVTSHELRTPLTAVTGYAQLLQTRWFELSDAQKRERLGRIVAAAARQQQLVESLLLLSDLDAGIPILARNTVLVQPLMQQAATEITAVYPDQQIDLAGPATLGVVGDAKYIANIVAAVLDNAAKHSPAGRPIAVNWMAEGDMAVIRVRDYGPGVPEDGHAYLFTLFGRLPGSSMRAGRVGTGLGLYLGRQMAEAMDGDLDLEETGSEGSTFRARLPLAPTTP